MAIEAYGKLPVTLANLEFKAMQHVPRGSQGEPAALVSLRLDGSGDIKGVTPFVVSSLPSRGDYDYAEPASLTECVSGLIVENNLLDANDQLSSDFILGAQGLVTPLRLKDLGREGLQQLIQQHTRCYADTSARFYGMIADKVGFETV